MKIVDEQPFNYEFTCRGCKSQLIAEADDVLVGYFGANYGGDLPDRQYYVTCPVCETDKTLKHGDVTPRVRAMADRKEKKR
jgi:hypothetical protein